MQNLLIRFLLLLAITFPINIVFGQTQPCLLLATYQYSNNNRLMNLKPLATLIERNVGIKVEVKSYPTILQLIDAIKDNRVDIALINTAGYMLMKDYRHQTMNPVAILEIPVTAKDYYKTAFVVSQDSELKNFGDLRKLAGRKSLTLVDKRSTSGNLVPRMMLAKIGIVQPEIQFASLNYSQTHDSAIESVASKLSDVAAMGSDEYFNYISHAHNNEKVRILELSEEIPLGPVLLKKNLHAETKSQIKQILFNLHRSNPEILQTLKNGWTEARHAFRFKPVNPKYLDKLDDELGVKEHLLDSIR